MALFQAGGFMKSPEAIDLRSESESEQEDSKSVEITAARKRLRRPERSTAKAPSVRTRRKVVEVDEDDEDEDDAMQLSHTMEAKDVTQGTTQEAGDGDESESPGFLTDDVESSSEDEERASRWRAKRGKAATKGKAAQKRQHAAVKKGGSASSSEDEVAVVKVVAPRRGVSKTIGLKRSRPEGTESAMGPRMGPLLSFMQRAENGGSSNRLAASKSSASEPQDQLWTDKYRPKKAADLSIPPKKVEEVRSWLLRSGSKGAPKLLVLRGPPGVGKSAMLEVLAKELGFEITSWDESGFSGGRGGWRGEERGVYSGGDPSYVSQAEDFKSFLRGTAFQALELDTKQGPSSSQGGGLATESQQASEKQLIVLEELPFQGSDKAASSFGGALSCFLHESRHPGVIVLTDENEDRGSLEMEKRLPREVLQSPLVSQIRCNPVTDANMRKILQRIGAAERAQLSAGDLSSVIMSTRGDVRHAILTMQLQLKANKKKGGRASRAPSSSSDAPEVEKDVYYSSFHAIGKILYAKREGGSGPGSGDGRPPLGFVPEKVLEHCDMEVDALTTFVQAHCVAHFGELDDLSEALALLSDTEVFISRVYSTQFHRDLSDPVYPESYAQSIVGRSIAHTNRHPIKPSGRHQLMTSPPLFECMRKRRSGLERLGHLCNDYVLDLTALGAPPARLNTQSMVTEMIPFTKAMAGSRPQANGGAGQGQDGGTLAGALSFLRLFNRRCCWIDGGRQQETALAQPAGLAADDIVEDD